MFLYLIKRQKPSFGLQKIQNGCPHNRLSICQWSHDSPPWENRSSGLPTRSDTNRTVKPQKMVRDLKFRIWKAEGLYYPSGRNKGADQLRGYREADLRLCFRICKNPVFSRRGSFYEFKKKRYNQTKLSIKLIHASVRSKVYGSVNEAYNNR